MVKNELFRFVSLRPAETITEESISKNYFFGPEDTVIAEAVKKGGNDLAGTIEEFKNSSNFFSGFYQAEGVMAKISKIHFGIKEFNKESKLLSGKEFRKLVKQTFERIPGNDKIRGLENNLWDSLYISVLEVRSFPRDRADIINALRIVKLIAYTTTEELSEEKLSLMLGARPVVPKFITSKAPADNSDIGQENNELTQKNKDQRLAIEKLKKRVNDLYAFEYEVEQLDRQKLLELEEIQKNKPSSNNINRRKVKSGEKTFVVEQDNSDLFKKRKRLSEEDIKKLSLPSKTLLSELKVNPALDSTENILKEIDREIKLTFNTLYQDSGKKSVSIAGGIPSSSSQQPQKISYEIDPNHGGIADPSYRYPEIFQDDNKYDNSIKTSLGTIKPLGIGDLLVVKESLLKYSLGEIAHVENVMQSENKERVHRRLDRQEETYTTSTESTEESERDLQLTDRFELQRETQKTIETSTTAEAGATFSAKFGPVVEVSANANVTLSSSKSESEKIASNYAKEIVDKSVTRITESLKEEIIKTTLLEIEETNTHGFNNDSENHIAGIYRWLEKYHLAQIYNYGSRLMMEFIIPEPAALYLYSLANKQVDGITLEKPKDLEEDFSYETITTSNYHIYASDYKVQGIKPPPAKYTTIATAINEPMTEKPLFNNASKEFYTITTKADTTLQVPDGYEAIEAYVIGTWTSLLGLDNAMDANKDSFDSDEDYEFKIVVGRETFDKRNSETFKEMNDEDLTIPIAVRAFNVLAYAFTVEIKCKRKSTTLDEWKIETYNAIIDSYNSLKAEYDAQLSNATANATSYNFGNSPDAKRKTEQDELKRGCITLLTDQHFADFKAVERNATSKYGYPEIDVAKAMEEKDYTLFFEQAFDWPQMTYIFYPYFWGDKSYWMDLMNLQDDDADFQAFLKAGAARVIVPVREGEAYINAVTYYLESGLIWNGGEAPVIGDELYLSIADEIKSTEDLSLTNAVPVGEPWEVKIPTSLVLLQDDASLPDLSEELGYTDEDVVE